MDKHRVLFLDYIRVIAIILVLILHTCEQFYMDSNGELRIDSEFDRMWISLVASFTRVCVPLFVMTSGYLLLPIKTNLSMIEFFKRRLIKVLIPFIICSLSYAILPLLWGAIDGVGVKQNLVHLLFNFNASSAHLWFVYMLVGLYLFMPIISPWLKKATKKEIRIFLGIWIFATICYLAKGYLPSLLGEYYTHTALIDGALEPALYGECWWNEFGSFWYFSGFIGYIVLAYYIKSFINWSVTKSIVVGGGLFIVGYLFTFIDFYLGTFDAISLESLEMAARNNNINVVMMSFGAFIMVKTIKLDKGYLYKSILEISKLSFGVYLYHIFIIVPVFKLIYGNFDNLTAMILISTTTLVLSLALTKLLQKLPKGSYIVG